MLKLNINLMSESIQHLAHFAHGMTLMFFIMMAIQILPNKKNNSIMNILFWIMIFWVFIELKDVGYLIDGVWSNPYISSIHLSIDLWCVPAIIILLFEVISPKWVTLRRVIVVFIPSFLLTLCFVITANDIFYAILIAYSIVVGSIALAIVLLASSRYDKFIKGNFSYIDNLTLGWIRFLIVVLYILLVLWTVTSSSSTWFGDVILYLAQIGLWMSFYYYAKKHNVVQTPNLSKLLFENRDKDAFYCGDCATSEGKDKIINDLQRIMQDDKIYLNPQLNVAILASAIGTNRTYLSTCLNNMLHINFYDYVNSYRVKEACELLKNSKGKTLNDIADSCGFNSTSTFRRAFEKNMNQTPNEYRNSFHKQS